jgi:hypothetical protein
MRPRSPLKKTKDISLRLRLPPELHAQVVKLAEANVRSLNSEIVYRIKTGILNENDLGKSLADKLTKISKIVNDQ